MRALIFHEPGRIAVESIADPTPGPGEVLLRTAAAGVCASDLRVYRGEKHAEPGVVPGHEFSGSVAACGEGVDSVQVGDDVTVYPLVTCGGCDFCRRGLRNRCIARRTLGYDLNGGIAEYVVLPAEIVAQGHIIPLPPGLPIEMGAMTEPTACVLNSLESCRFKAGSSMAIIGAGPMGLLHLVLARALGAGAIVVSEPDPLRRAMADKLGATAVTGADDAETEAAVKDATGGEGADVVIVSVGLNGLTERALPITARQGSINLFAGFPPKTSAQLDVNELHYKEIILTGTQNATPDQFRRTASLLPSIDDLDRLVTHRYGMENADQAYSIRANPAALKTMVLPRQAEDPK